jgi:hypothetical protein
MTFGFFVRERIACHLQDLGDLYRRVLRIGQSVRSRTGARLDGRQDAAQLRLNVALVPVLSMEGDLRTML